MSDADSVQLNTTMERNTFMKKSTKAFLATAAMAGLMAGSAGRLMASTSTPSKTTKSQFIQKEAGVKAFALADDDKDKDKGKHDCKGKNDCKGQGGCKTDDNGCKGKNDCKGKGGCNTKDKKDDEKKE